MKTKRLLLFMLLTLVLAGCASPTPAATASVPATSTSAPTATPTATPMPSPTPTPEPTPTPVPPALSDYPVDPEKLASLPENLEALATSPELYQQAPDPLVTGLEFFNQWLAEALIPALPEFENVHLQAQYLATDPVATHIVGNNNYRRPMGAAPVFFYFEHDGDYFPGFYFKVSFEEAFRNAPVSVFLFAVDTPQNPTDRLLSSLANTRLNFDYLTLSNGADTAYPMAVNQLITQGFKPNPETQEDYLLGLGSLNFTVLP